MQPKISPTLHKNIGSNAIKFLLHIFNLSLTNGNIPQVWHKAKIIPLLKANKPLSVLLDQSASHHVLVSPRKDDICLNILKRNGWISGQQLGFRKRRGVEDQIIWVAWAVLDGFQERQRSVMALLDFSKAYDTVLRQRLLNTLLKIRLNN